MVADDEPESVVELGGELAAAEAAERRHVSPGPSPIAHLRYPRERSVAVGVADGDLCVLVIAASAGAGGQTTETPETLARFLPTAIHG